ncbi:hypothetical protein WMF27_38515 [Sorangium sp. So ce281]|uniref:hypothetical protein n=1 Tax=unclassified Sorangium TaxID=2621164 RepID=UPI003F5FF2B2
MERADRLVLRAWIRVVPAKEGPGDKHATAVVEPIGREVLETDGFRRRFVLARRCERTRRFIGIDGAWRVPAADRGDRKSKEQDNRAF